MAIGSRTGQHPNPSLRKTIDNVDCKRCSRCRSYKPLTEFSRRTITRRLHSWCKGCAREHSNIKNKEAKENYNG